MKRIPLYLLLVALLASVVVLISRHRQQPILVRLAVAASLRPAMEELTTEYERATGERVAVQYGGSEELLAQIKLISSSTSFDTYLPADDSYLSGLPIKERHTLGTMHAVVLHTPTVTITTWHELTAPGRRLALADPSSAAIGKLSKRVLSQENRWASLQARIVVNTDTVTHSANAVKLGTVDAAIVWDVVASQQFRDLPRVTLPELAGIRANVVAAKLTDRPESDRFWVFLTQTHQARMILVKHGFAVGTP